MSARWLGALVGCALFALACRRHPSADECLAMLDRYVELRVRADDPSATDDRIRALKAQLRATSEKSPSFANCPTEVTRAEIACAMSAANADDIEKCLE